MYATKPEIQAISTNEIEESDNTEWCHSFINKTYSIRADESRVSDIPVKPPDPGLELGREPLPPEVNGRLAPPVTKGAPSQNGPPPTRPFTTTPAPAAGTQAGHQALRDHDYFSRPPQLDDHTYFKPLPEVSPPPGFSYPPQHGRPSRNITRPSRFQDFDMS